MARPRTRIDNEKVEALASIGCTYEEIAAVLGHSVPTLKRRCKEHFRSGQERMRMSIRRMQYEKAKDGNVAMQIWLGKQYLGQRDRTDTNITETTIEVQRLAPPRTEH